MIQIISPHLDDAVLSLGQYIAVSGSRVVTVLAGVPEGDVTAYDMSCGFDSSTTAVHARRTEDAKACAELGAEPVHLDYLDQQYRHDDSDLQAAITRGLWQLGGRPTFIPLGIGHPDHVLVSDCALDAFAPVELFVYEELPYRVLTPEQVSARLTTLERRGFTLEQYFPRSGSIERKLTAIGCYQSQFPDGAIDPCLSVPERLWRVSRCA